MLLTIYDKKKKYFYFYYSYSLFYYIIKNIAVSVISYYITASPLLSPFAFQFHFHSSCCLRPSHPQRPPCYAIAESSRLSASANCTPTQDTHQHTHTDRNEGTDTVTVTFRLHWFFVGIACLFLGAGHAFPLKVHERKKQKGN